MLCTQDSVCHTNFYFHADALGSIIDITTDIPEGSTDYQAQIVEHYSYDVFGNVKIFSPKSQLLTQSSIGNTFTFTGREWDAETGLYYYRARYYDPKLGRFLSTDPVGYEDSTNLYQYCGNNPVNLVDPMGKKCISKQEILRRILNKLGLEPKLISYIISKYDTSKWGPKWVELFILGYGEYGGPMRTDPTFQAKPKDSMDRAFMEHDQGWLKGRIKEADKKLYQDLIDLPSDPKKWDEPAQKPTEAKVYREIAQDAFWWINRFRGN